MGNSPLALSTVTRMWEVDGHIILLRSSSKYILDVYMDGKEIYIEERKTYGVPASTSHTFRIGDKRITIQVVPQAKVQFVLTVEGATVPDSLQIPCREDTHNMIQVKIPETKVFRVNSKPVTWYVISATMREDGRELVVNRRFSEFTKLDKEIRSYFHGNHLLSSVPTLPSKLNVANAKKYVTSSGHDDDFVEDRRRELEVYLKKLVAMPRVPFIPYLRIFLSLDPSLQRLNPLELSYPGDDAVDQQQQQGVPGGVQQQQGVPGGAQQQGVANGAAPNRHQQDSGSAVDI